MTRSRFTEGGSAGIAFFTDSYFRLPTLLTAGAMLRGAAAHGRRRNGRRSLRERGVAALAAGGGAVVLLVVAGCGGGPESRVRDASSALGRAVREKNAERVVERLAGAARARVSKELVAEALAKYAGENEALVREIETGAYEVRVEVSHGLSAGRSIEFVSKGGSYFVEFGAGFDGATSDPRTLLARLREALERLSEAELVALLVPEKRVAFSRLVESVRNELLRVEDVNFVEHGAYVIARFPSGLAIRLRKVGENYFVEELE